MNNEPVAWMDKTEGILSFDYMGAGFIPLYTHPVKELTDEEINELANKYLYVLNDVPYANDIKDFARAILRKAQEK